MTSRDFALLWLHVCCSCLTGFSARDVRKFYSIKRLDDKEQPGDVIRLRSYDVSDIKRLEDDAVNLKQLGNVIDLDTTYMRKGRMKR